MTGTKVNPQVKAASVVAASQRVAVLQIEPTPQSSFDLRNVPGQFRSLCEITAVQPLVG